MMKQTLRVMIMAGGTGGHIFPALAVAREFQARGAEVYWLGSVNGMETRLIPETGIPLFLLPVEGVRGRGLRGLLKAPALMLSAVTRARQLLKEMRPTLVVGFGGFASGPGGVAAKMLGIPLVIHEQNAIAGTTNRLLAKVASRVLTAFPDVLKGGLPVGNPVREEIVNLPAPEQRQNQIEPSEPMRLLVLGGSLGARFINELLPETLALMDADQRPAIWHQAGRDQEKTVGDDYGRRNIAATVEAFIDDMASAYAWADLVICRAGALTVSELMAVGVPAILIPFPHAIDDHQYQNAQVLVKAGAADCVRQSEMTPETLMKLLENEAKPETRLRQARKGRAMAHPDAARKVVEHSLEVVNG